MFREGEYVMYSGEGLCRIEKIGVPDFQSEKKEYYFLRNSENSSRIYVPTDTLQPMRRPMTAAEAAQFLEGLDKLSITVPKKGESKRQLQVIRETVRAQTAEAMAKTIRMIRALHPDGKYPAVEKMILDRTEKSLCEEMAYALQIPKEEAEVKVRNAVKTLGIKDNKKGAISNEEN